MLSMLLEGAIDTLDISPEMRRSAVESYEEVGNWLAEHGGQRVEIYPQGSFLLGTVVRPYRGAGEFDIDLVFLLRIARESTTQEELKERVGNLLYEYAKWKKAEGQTDGPITCESCRRCWKLTYPGFHLDVLPSVPDAEHLPLGICLTDEQLVKWQKSNPIGYAAWFAQRSVELQDMLIKAAYERHINVAEVPVHEFRSTLQRVVQVLKWHAMMRFAKTPDLKPPSILITTLAARAYRGETDLFTATRSVLAGMLESIENRNGTWWVPNPAHEEENFVDKWADYPERRAAFFAWHSSIAEALGALRTLEGRGIHVVAAELTKSFSAEPVTAAVSQMLGQMAIQRDTGIVRMTATGALTTATAAVGPRSQRHTFHGQHPRA
ncbi:MAG TPA: nucleotidyltransferase [Micromonosporaceae bacterium]|nr:nucleotidyltransferase [Micromonosporaceae bacterium]HCU49185.1 nucleotidyltransferase [Micromonosporaceae bacterium]